MKTIADRARLLMKPLTPTMPRRWVAGLALLILYAPYSWVIIVSHPWNSERWLWIKMWPVLPGVVTLYLSRPFLPRSWSPPWTEVSTYLIASIMSVLLATIVIVCLLRVRRAFWPLLAGVSVLSCFFGQ